jgi:hypothetical protein
MESRVRLQSGFAASKEKEFFCPADFSNQWLEFDGGGCAANHGRHGGRPSGGRCSVAAVDSRAQRGPIFRNWRV